MQNSQLPAKWFKPFAADDVNKVEIPVTTAVAGRASQALGFPPETMQPPESGGVPPQGEDFNGAMNQVARIVWWMMAGGAIPFDAAFAGNANIGGYPAGARVAASDYSGIWFSTVENNVVNPDTVGTGWAPGPFYGVAAITGLAAANVTLTPLQAAKPRITLAGTLTANIQVIVPAWVRDFVFVNSTTGAFTITVKTAAGAGVTIPQNSAPTPVTGDGTNIVATAPNRAAATTGTQAATFGQFADVVGQSRNVRMTVAAASATGTLTADEIVVKSALGGLSYLLNAFSQTINLATTGAGGMDTGTAPASGYVAVYAIYNPTTNTRALLAATATAAVAPDVYGGANMPSGFTASALVAVLPTTAASLIKACMLDDRAVSFQPVQVTTASTAGAYTSLSIAAAVPRNAKRVTGEMQVSSAGISNGIVTLYIAANGAEFGRQVCSLNWTGSSTSMYIASNCSVPILTAQTVFYAANTSGSGPGAPGYIFWVSSYTF